AQKLGLSVTSFGEVTRDYTVFKDRSAVCRLYFTFLSEAEEAWEVVPGRVFSTGSMKDGLKESAKLTRYAVFTLLFEYDKDFDVDNEQVSQMADLLSELAFAFRHKLTPDGLKLKRVVVKARGGEAEKKV